MRKASYRFAAAAPRGLAWLSLLAASGGIAYAMTTALVSSGLGAVNSVPPIRLESEAARNPTTEADVIATLRQWLATRGLDTDIVSAPMLARAPGYVTAADFVDENGIDTSIGSIQSEAWLVSTAAGRWWVWEYVSAPANGRALMHDSHSYGP